MSEYENTKNQLLKDIKNMLLSHHSTSFKEDLNKMLLEVKDSVNEANVGLSKAIKNNNLENFKMYIDLGAVLNDEKGEILLRVLKTRNMEMLKVAQQHGLNIHFIFQNKESLLLKAVRTNNIEAVKYLVDQGLDIHLNEDIALCIATRDGQLEIIEFLLEKGADVNTGGGIPLKNVCKGMHVPKEQHVKTVKLLVDYGVKFNNFNNGFLLELGKNGALNVVQYLIEQGLIIPSNHDILSFACQNGHLEMVKYLIEDLKMQTYFVHENSEKSLFIEGIRSENKELLNYLLLKSQLPQIEVNKALGLIEEDSQLETLKFLVEKGADIEEDNSFVLRHCCEKNSTKNTLYLINVHPNISTIGEKILKIAATKQNYEVMETLLQMGFTISPSQRNNLKGDVLEWINKYAFTIKLNNTLDKKEELPKAKM